MLGMDDFLSFRPVLKKWVFDFFNDHFVFFFGVSEWKNLKFWFLENQRILLKNQNRRTVHWFQLLHNPQRTAGFH